MTHPDYPTIRVFPGDNAFAASSNALAIPRMFRESAMAFKTRTIPYDDAAKLLAADGCLPLGRLIYCAALFGAEGRLVLNADPDDKLKLTDWPDFNAVPHLPEHRTVAKFMLVNTADLADIAAATDVSIRVVVDFCNACEAVGLVRRVSDRKAGRSRPAGIAQIMERMRSLFGDS